MIKIKKPEELTKEELEFINKKEPCSGNLKDLRLLKKFALNDIESAKVCYKKDGSVQHISIKKSDKWFRDIEKQFSDEFPEAKVAFNYWKPEDTWNNSKIEVALCALYWNDKLIAEMDDDGNLLRGGMNAFPKTKRFATALTCFLQNYSDYNDPARDYVYADLKKIKEDLKDKTEYLKKQDWVSKYELPDELDVKKVDEVTPLKADFMEAEDYFEEKCKLY